MTEQERQAFELGRRVERAAIKLRLHEGTEAHTELSEAGDFFLRYRGKTYGPFPDAAELVQAIDEAVEMEQQREEFFLVLDEGN